MSIIVENLALFLWSGDTRTIDTPYAFSTVDLGLAMIAVPKVVAFSRRASLCAGLCGWSSARTDLGRAIRAVAKERQGALLVGIDVDHVLR